MIKRILNEVSKTVIREIKKPKSFVKGETFEKFVDTVVYPENEFTKLYETPNYNSTNERFNDSAKFPDFKFQHKKSKQIFWVECKFRNNLNNKNQIEVLKPYQLKRNQNLKEPVFYVIGLMGKPNNPEYLFEIPQENIYCNVYLSHAEKFSIWED